MAGFSIKDPAGNELKKVTSYADALNALREVKAGIIKLNKESRSYFKFAPGSQAAQWGRFHSENIAAISFVNLELGDVSK